MPLSTVQRVCVRHGLNKLPPLNPPPEVRRYEWKHPGDLIHLDIKKLGRIERVGHRIHGDRTTRRLHAQAIEMAGDGDRSRIEFEGLRADAGCEVGQHALHLFSVGPRSFGGVLRAL